MYKQQLVLAITLLITAGSYAQWWGSNKKIKGNNDVETITRKTSDYESVHLKGSWDVQLVKGTEGELKITGESNLLEYIITDVDGNKLTIQSKDGYSLNTSFNKSIVITVPFKDLNGIYLSGSGDITTSDVVKSEDLEVLVSGSGDVNVTLEAKNLKGKVTGSGDLVLKGKTMNFECSVTGSGDVSAYGVQANNVDASVTGSGDIQVIALESIRGRITGSGDIDYKGNPATKDTKVLGSGDISAN